MAVYDDRVEITSPGMLYGGLTIEQIKEGGSKIRNRCIAEVFGRMKIIESWGTGIKRMFSSCKAYGIREPELLEVGDSFRVNLYRPSYHEVHQSSPKSSPKNLNATQQKIADMILENPKVTQVDMAEKLDISTRAVKKSIKDLTEKGILERVGSSRSGYWKLKD
ncbi:MAG: ATP-binding protein [Lachnospiraceae bacterium]|nr:ATP-binding protein [Lachnospiraceae bacterium]